MRLVTFNAWSAGQPHDQLRDNLLDLAEAAERPDVIALQEAKRYRDSIRGYRRVALDEGHPEFANCVLLVRSNFKLIRAASLSVDGPTWRGPKHGLKHPPRVFPWVVVEDDNGQRWDVMNVHRTPGGPYPHIKANAESWAAEHRALLAWFAEREAKHPGRPRVILGDQNNRKTDLRNLSVRDLARRVDGALVMKGIDGAIGVNATLAARQLPDLYGSDHHKPVVITAHRKEH